MRRLFIIALAGLLASTGIGSAADAFGQDIPAEIDQIVERAKTLRLPYSKNPETTKADAEEAARLLEPLVQSRPEYYRAWFNLGMAYNQAGDYAKSDAAFEKAIELRQKLGIKDITLLNSAGWASMGRGDYATAEKRLLLAYKDLAQGSDYTKSAVLNNLGLVYFYTQRFDEAKKYLGEARDKFGSTSAIATLAMITETNEIVKYQVKSREK